MSLKAAWITPGDAGLHTLTLESQGIELEHRILVHERAFPASTPQRHTIQIAGLSQMDLDTLRELLDVTRDHHGYGQGRVDV